MSHPQTDRQTALWHCDPRGRPAAPASGWAGLTGDSLAAPGRRTRSGRGNGDGRGQHAPRRHFSRLDSGLEGCLHGTGTCPLTLAGLGNRKGLNSGVRPSG